MPSDKRILFTAGPATTTDTVKNALVMPDIFPREEEVENLINCIREDLCKIVHGGTDYVAVPFCGSGTLCMDACLNSLTNKGKVLIVENGQFSRRAVGICDHYNIPFIRLEFPYTEKIDLNRVEQALINNPEVEIVYSTHQESTTGIVNPIREIGELAHRYDAISVVDTLSTYALMPIDVNKENIDFCMGAAQKGIMSYTGFSYVIGRREIIERSRNYPSRSFYTNLYMQYEYFRDKGMMHFTPPTQVIYSVYQALKEYWIEGEQGKYKRHLEAKEVLFYEMEKLGFKTFVDKELLLGMITSWRTPNDSKWNYKKIHDYCYKHNFEILPSTIFKGEGFRLACFGTVDSEDAKRFMGVFADALHILNVNVPVKY